MPDNDKYHYYLGYRDALAYVLAVNKDGIKLPDLAKFYEESFKEKHFSHDWHVSK